MEAITSACWWFGLTKVWLCQAGKHLMASPKRKTSVLKKTNSRMIWINAVSALNHHIWLKQNSDPPKKNMFISRWLKSSTGYHKCLIFFTVNNWLMLSALKQCVRYFQTCWNREETVSMKAQRNKHIRTKSFVRDSSPYWGVSPINEQEETILWATCERQKCVERYRKPDRRTTRDIQTGGRLIHGAASPLGRRI